MNNQSRQTIKSELCRKSFSSEISKDYSLPDYQPEIKRLVKITANVLPPKMDFGMDDAVFSGNVDYYILYIGSDNQMYCAPISDEYMINMPLEAKNMGEFYDAFTDIYAESVNGRVTAPRNITVRAKLRCNTTVFSNCAVNDGFSDGAVEESVKRLNGSVLSCDTKRVVSEPIRVNDEIILDTRDGDIRVICADGRVMLTEVKGNNNEAYLRGDTYIKILASKENSGTPFIFQRKIPIFATITLTGADMGSSLFAKGSVSELSVIVDEGRISLDVGVVFDCMSCRNVSVSYVKDMYSTVCKSRCDHKKYSVINEAGGGLYNFTFSETRTLEELSIDPESQIVDVSAIAKIDSTLCENSRLKASGNVKYTVILEKNGEYSGKDIELPFTYIGECRPQTKNIFSSCEVISTRGKLDGERISLDSEISLIFKAYCENDISAVEAMHFGDLLNKNEKQTVVVFPTREDSVWSIAKKYCVASERIISSNQALMKNAEMPLDDVRALSKVHHIII